VNRPQRERVDGLLLLDKPVGLTSNDALLRVRRLFNARKAGHGGTLDPLASGLLPVALGEATKFAVDALDADKVYRAELTFGITTATGDAEGETLESRPVRIDRERLREALAGFVGVIEQTPPMHSALKHLGRPLYEYARAGQAVERAARQVTIHALELLSLEPVAGLAPGAPGSWRAALRVCCSKGTYVRVLAEDIGARLGCGAHLSALRRERVGPLEIGAALTLERLEAMTPAERLGAMAPVDVLLRRLAPVVLDGGQARRFVQGQRLRIAAAAEPEPSASAVPPQDEDARVRVYHAGVLLGTGRLHDGVLAPERVIAADAAPEPADGSAVPPAPLPAPVESPAAGPAAAVEPLGP